MPATLKVEYPKDLLKLVGTELGPSEWMRSTRR